MQLLGGPLLVVLIVLALLMPVGVITIWPRVRGPRAAQMSARFGLVLVAQLAALSAGLVALNDYGQFFTSWSELFGTASPARVVGASHYGAANPQPKHLHALVPAFTHVAAVRSDSLPAGVDATSWAPQNEWRRRGEVVTVRLTGATTGLSEVAQVYLPPSYFGGRRAMPLVEVMSGYPGSALALVDRLHYPADLLSAIAGGTPSMVLVMMRPAVTSPRDTECTNVPNGPQAFSYFARDVPAAVSAKFGLQPTSYGAMGDSTGAMCAVKLAVVDPQQFTAAVSLSGYFHAIRDATTGDLYGGSTATRQLNDIIWRMRNLPLPPVSVLVATALTEKGADGYRSAQQFLGLVQAPMSADEIVLNHGGHNFQTWNREIPSALRWLGRHLP